MKKAIFSLLVLTSLTCSAQTDSSVLRSGKLILRMNDWEYLTTFISYTNTYENLFDSIKNKIRPLSAGQYPNGTTLITVDSASNAELLGVCLVIKADYNPATSSAISRITTAVRGINNPWINNQLDAYDLIEAAAFINRKNEGKLRLRKR